MKWSPPLILTFLLIPKGVPSFLRNIPIYSIISLFLLKPSLGYNHSTYEQYIYIYRYDHDSIFTTDHWVTNLWNLGATHENGGCVNLPRQDIPFPPPEDKNQECLNTIANACGLLAVLALLGTISCIVPWSLECLGDSVGGGGWKIMKTFFSTWSVFWILFEMPSRKGTQHLKIGRAPKGPNSKIFRASRCTAENWLGYPDAESEMILEQFGETKLPNIVGGEFPWLNLSFKMEQIWYRCIYLLYLYVYSYIYIYIHMYTYTIYHISLYTYT